MAPGFWNRVLRVDLTSGQVGEENPDEAFYRKYLGGRSFIAHYLLAEVPRGVDAFSPENRLVFAAGPVTGIPMPGSGRHSVGAKSPQTGGFGEGESGGYWGAELKHAGWDTIVVQGRAERPTYLWIDEDRVELRDASHLWGRLTGEVEETLRAELGDRLVRVTQCGIAGENRVRYACVVNDLNEVAGRTGLGAVMGSKNLKAIAVRGKQRVPVADPSVIQGVAKWVADTIPEKHYNFHTFGTGAAMLGKHLEGHLPVRNFRDGVFPTVTQIDAKAIKAQYLTKMDGCYACSVRCKKRVKIEARCTVDPKYGGPEYETIAAIGSDVGVDDLVAVCKANELLNLYGLDSISCGATIAWAMECAEEGLLTPRDTGGVALRFGDGDQVCELIGMIARRQGIGDLLAEGALGAARRIGRGTERYAVHVKGLEIAMHDPRAMAGMLGNYPVTPTGGDHTGGAHYRTSLRNTAGVCQFLQYDEPRMVDIINATTGWGVSLPELELVTRRGLTLARLFNLREGLTRADDRLPPRMHEPIRSGPLSSKVLTTEEVDRAVEAYYEQQGWDRQTGVPTRETLGLLGLSDEG
ncbi:MAG: aldehyde ferredoxin oxidoreductase family protein [Chloroflexi bacterium]|nr:aldehyde ferredoxin oxidoreductase family protein [Chloroflexota bacterium]